MHLSKRFMFEESTNDWDIKRGYPFKFKELGGVMSTGDRSILEAMNNGVKFTQEEFEAMRAMDADDSSKKPFQGIMTTVIRQANELAYSIEKERYGNSAQLRYEAKSHEPIYPFGYIRFAKPMNCGRDVCSYSISGRARIHDLLECNTALLHELMRTQVSTDSIELADNRLSLFTAQNGKCAVTGEEFMSVSEIVCHHKHPKKWHGGDRYQNLVLVSDTIHQLIHTYDNAEVKELIKKARLTEVSQFEKLNKLRKKACRKPIDAITKEIVTNGMTKKTKTVTN